MRYEFAALTGAAIPVHLVDQDDFETWNTTQPAQVQSWLANTDFTGKLGQLCLIRDESGALLRVVAGWGTPDARARGRFHSARIAAKLPKGTYELHSTLTGADLEQAALGWLISGYTFDRYTEKSKPRAALVAPAGINTQRLENLTRAEALTRDLINTPANDMGPDQLEQAVCDLAQRFQAQLSVTKGDDLLSQNFPLIHAVGRAGPQAPRLLDLRWGQTGPKITLVGKGVCFDTGGLNLKPGASMGLMKKDMGGAANTIGLAHMIMAQNLPCRLRVLIPAVENSVSASAFRPGDILTSRKGLTVEINNTDAEGRLVLADALTLADEDAPDMIASLATLTGAARVALGPDIAPFYTTDDGLADQLAQTAGALADPVWRMPFWPPYEDMIIPGIADLDNAPAGGFAGSITAALFLRRFVTGCPSYTHFDIYAWRPSGAPGAPKGGLGQGARALFGVIEGRV
jgi:leucyl aminopeptidase